MGVKWVFVAGALILLQLHTKTNGSITSAPPSPQAGVLKDDALVRFSILKDEAGVLKEVAREDELQQKTKKLIYFCREPTYHSFECSVQSRS